MSMLGYATESKLKNLLVALANGEREIEASRQKLARFTNFTLLSAFERIDRSMSNHITSNDILKFLRDNSVYSVSENEVFNLVKYFENDLKYSLDYKEFSQILLPCEDSRLRNDVLARRPYVRIGRFQLLQRDIELTVVEIILKEIQLARHVSALKKNLEMSYDYSKSAAFRALDVMNRGILNIYALEEFFRKNHHFMTDYEMMAIIRRIDTEGDAQISFMEFADFMNTELDGPLSKTAPIQVYSPPYRRTPPLLPTIAELYPYHYQYTYPYYRYSPRATSSIMKSPPRVVDDNINLSFRNSLERSRSYYSPYNWIYTRYY